MTNEVKVTPEEFDIYIEYVNMHKQIQKKLLTKELNEYTQPDYQCACCKYSELKCCYGSSICSHCAIAKAGHSECLGLKYFKIMTQEQHAIFLGNLQALKPRFIIVEEPSFKIGIDEEPSFKIGIDEEEEIIESNNPCDYCNFELHSKKCNDRQTVGSHINDCFSGIRVIKPYLLIEDKK